MPSKKYEMRPPSKFVEGIDSVSSSSDEDSSSTDSGPGNRSFEVVDSGLVNIALSSDAEDNGDGNEVDEDHGDGSTGDSSSESACEAVVSPRRGGETPPRENFSFMFSKAIRHVFSDIFASEVPFDGKWSFVGKWWIIFVHAQEMREPLKFQCREAAANVLGFMFFCTGRDEMLDKFMEFSDLVNVMQFHPMLKSMKEMEIANYGTRVQVALRVFFTNLTAESFRRFFQSAVETHLVEEKYKPF